jgi:hypothetical protein
MICPACGLALYHTGICAHHTGDYDRAPWAESNRRLCDYIHRGVPLKRLSLADRFDLGQSPVDMEVA